MEFIYHCKKNDRDYVYTTDIEFVQPQDAYAWRRGVREYADNYHASVTRKGWEGTDEEFAAEIDAHCTEALTRFNAGDVPGERKTDSSATAGRALAKRLGVNIQFFTTLTDDELQSVIANIEKSRAKKAA